MLLLFAIWTKINSFWLLLFVIKFYSRINVFKKRDFLFHLKISLCYWDVQVENLWIFENLNFHDVIKFRTMKQEFVPNKWAINNILLKNLKTKHSLVMTFDQFMSYYKRKYFFKDLYEKDCLETTSRSFCVCKEVNTTSIEKWEISWLYWICNSKTSKICLNYQVNFFKFLFTEDSLNIKRTQN